MDRMQVVRADDAGIECPEPGMVRDGDFDGDGTAWSSLGDAVVEDRIGQSRSRAGRLRTQKLCQGAALTGLASWPLNSSLANPALRFFWSGTTGRVLEVSAGGFRLARLSAITTPRTSTVCLPPSSQGLAETISFAVPRTSGLCATDDVRDFMVDSIEVVSAPDCEDDAYLVDGDFELALTNTVSSGWATFYREPNGTAGVDTRDAQSGSASLRLVRRQNCAIISAQATFVVPKPDAVGGACTQVLLSGRRQPADGHLVNPRQRGLARRRQRVQRGNRLPEPGGRDETANALLHDAPRIRPLYVHVSRRRGVH